MRKQLFKVSRNRISMSERVSIDYYIKRALFKKERDRPSLTFPLSSSLSSPPEHRSKNCSPLRLVSIFCNLCVSVFCTRIYTHMRAIYNIYYLYNIYIIFLCLIIKRKYRVDGESFQTNHTFSQLFFLNVFSTRDK